MCNGPAAASVQAAFFRQEPPCRTACFLAIATVLGASAHAADPAASLTRAGTAYAGTGPVGDGSITFDAPIPFFQDDKSEWVATAAFGKPGVTYSDTSGLVSREAPDKNNTP